MITRHYKLIALYLSKQTELENPDLKHQINFIGRLKINEEAIMFFIIEKSEEKTFEFSQKAAAVVRFWLFLNMETDNESSKFATRKWYVINDQNKGLYNKCIGGWGKGGAGGFLWRS